MTREEAGKLITETLELSKADDCQISLLHSRDANLRFARNEVTTSGDTENRVITITSSFGQRSGSATTNQTDPASLARTVALSEQIARYAPEDKERMPLLGQTDFPPVDAWDEETAAAPPSYRASVVKRAIDAARAKNVVLAGFLTTSAREQVVANSNGLFAMHRQTAVTYSNTARTRDGSGSGWGGSNGERIGSFDTKSLIDVAIDKALKSVRAKELAPGTYTVILEPAAVADLVSYLAPSLDARSADEGRSFFSRKGGGSRIGESVVSPKVTIYSDPADPRAATSPFTGEGLAIPKTVWIEKGNLRQLPASRFWAQKQNRTAIPNPQNLFMDGENRSLEDLIRGTQRGVLITRLWYIRFVDPQQILLTGLTRDGAFLIENGRIRHAVKNFRWNDSPISALGNIEAMSRPVRARGSESEDFPIVVPAIRTRFTFSSLSDAV
jgi:predicted Zn-dependent protease